MNPLSNFYLCMCIKGIWCICCCCCCVASVVSDSVRPHRRQPTRPPVPGILQARTLEWVAISSSNPWKWKVKVKSLSRVQLLATPWTAAYQAPPSMGFSRQKYWSGVPLPSPNCTWLSESKTKLSSFCCVTEHILMKFTWKQCIIPLRMSRIFFSLFYSSLKGNCEGWSGSSHIRS